VEELAYSGPRAQAFVDNNPVGKPQRFPLIVAVEKGAIKDVIHGTRYDAHGGRGRFNLSGQPPD